MDTTNNTKTYFLSLWYHLESFMFGEEGIYTISLICEILKFYDEASFIGAKKKCGDGNFSVLNGKWKAINCMLIIIRNEAINKTSFVTPLLFCHRFPYLHTRISTSQFAVYRIMR